MNVQFASGSNQIPGWLNTEYPDHDITKPLKFKDSSVDKILAEHVCEHVSAPDCLRFFEECHRILKPGGILRVCVPVLDRIQDYAHLRDLVVGHGHMVVFNLYNLISLLHIAGFEKVTEEIIDKNIDGHWKTIGEAKDLLETLRVHAHKKS